MEATPSPDTPTNPNSKKKPSRWKRSAQVCTNCRRSKLRCDYLERHPAPCTRCARATERKVCQLEPQKRGYGGGTDSSTDGWISSSAEDPDGIDESFSAAIASLLPLEPDPLLSHTPPSGTKSLSHLTFTDEEVRLCFNEFFQFYHPFCRLFLGPLDPASCYSRSELLFWVICSVSCRPRPDHAMLRARKADLIIAMNKALEPLISALILGHPRHTLCDVQALLILAQWTFATTQRGMISSSWKWTALAIQIGFMLGLHRPHFAGEFTGHYLGDETPGDPAERSLAWVQCYIVRQSIAATLGLPSGLADDWVISTAAGPAPSAEAGFFAAFHADVPPLLRIERFVCRLSAVLGNNAHSRSGQYDSAVAPSLVALLGGELDDLEREMQGAGVSPTVTVALLDARVQLHTFGWQLDGEAPQHFLASYGAAMRILQTLHELTRSRDTAALFWPSTVYQNFIMSSICLIKLASIQTLHPHKVPIDRKLVLREVRTAHAIVTSRSVMPDDNGDKVGQLIHFLVKKLMAAGTRPGAGAEREMVSGRARMSLGNLLFDAHHQMKRHLFELEQSGKAAPPGMHPYEHAVSSIPNEEFDGQQASGYAMPPVMETSPRVLPPTPETFDADVLMNTFEDFAFTGDPGFDMGELSAEMWADMVNAANLGDLNALWTPDNVS